MTILSAADWPEVRECIDVTLDATLVPDSAIARDAVQGEAEREVLSRDSNALTYTAGSDNAKRVRLAAIYLTAARLAVALPSFVSEQTPEGQRYQRQAVDPLQLAARLRQLAGEVFAAYLEPSSPSSAVPFAFATAPGRRGR